MQNSYQYKITFLAESDMEEALSYITNNLCNLKAAKDLYLVTDENIRKIIINNFVLIYEIKQEIKEIDVLRFRYAKMDLRNLKVKED